MKNVLKLLCAILFIGALVFSCEEEGSNPSESNEVENCKKGKERTVYLQDEVIVHITDHSAMPYLMIAQILAEGDFDYGFCKCDSSLFKLIYKDVILNPNERISEVRSRGEDEAFDFSLAMNLEFPVLSLDPVTISTPNNISIPEIPNYQSENTVEVAIIDSGVDYNHDSLKDKMWKANPVYCNIEKIGYDFKNEQIAPVDDTGHGTHVAGIIESANLNSELGLRLMNLKITDGSTADLFSAICAIKFAVKNEVPIVNMSWGYYSDSPDEPLVEVIQAAENTLFVTSAGNDHVNNDDCNHWPSNLAYYSGLDNVIAVGTNTPAGDHLESFSNYGDHSVHLMAPGKAIFSTVPNNSCGAKTGTSMSTAFVSRLAAEIEANNFGQGPLYLKNQIHQAVMHVPNVADKLIWDGLITGPIVCSPFIVN